MLAAQTRRLHLARRPIQALGHLQPFLARHGTEGFDLFCVGLFIRQHEFNMRDPANSRKQVAGPCAARRAAMMLDRMEDDGARSLRIPV